MSHFTREEFIDAMCRASGNREPHPYIKKWFAAWSELATPLPPGALHNIFNSTQAGFGSDLMPRFGSGDIRNYPTFEDGVSATAYALQTGGYPTLFDALKNNTPENLMNVSGAIVNELNVWSGNGNYAQQITELANTGKVSFAETFPGRHWGQQ